MTKDTEQEDCPGTEQREPAPALLGMAVSPDPLLTPSSPGQKEDTRMTFRRSYPGHILRHFMLAATVPLFQGKGESPPSGPCSSPTVPGGCYEAIHGRTPETELRTAGIGPFPKLHLLCSTTSPPSNHRTLLPAPSQNSCRSWLCLQRLQSQCGDHEAVPFLGGKPGSTGHSVPSPAQMQGQGPAQVPEQCQAGRIPAKALIRHHHSISEPGKSALVTQRREEKFRLVSWLL